MSIQYRIHVHVHVLLIHVHVLYNIYIPKMNHNYQHYYCLWQAVCYYYLHKYTDCIIYIVIMFRSNLEFEQT